MLRRKRQQDKAAAEHDGDSQEPAVRQESHSPSPTSASEESDSALGEEPPSSEEESSEEEQLPEDYDSDSDEESDSDEAEPSEGDESDSANAQGSSKSALPDEYQEDSSDEEDIRNTVGNIPLEWYKDHDHLGYDVGGKKIMKPSHLTDGIDDFLEKMENPDYWRTVLNKFTGEKTVLTKDDVDIIRRLQRGANPSASQENYPEWTEFFTSEEMIHPVTNAPKHKRSFIPSKWERLKVGQMVNAIKRGWLKPRQKKTAEEEEKERRRRFDLWADEPPDNILRRHQMHIPPSKRPLPGNAESYNPPPEYLFTAEEEKKWREQEDEERRSNFIPKKYSSLRLVPAYPNFIKEEFERCLDLVLCPRQIKMKMNVNPEDLIPKLPKPQDLEPYPKTQSMVWRGHQGMVCCISLDPTGQILASGSDDGTVRFWEVSTGRCLKTVEVGGHVRSVSWNPKSSMCLLAAAVDKTLVMLNPGFFQPVADATDNTLLASDDAQHTDTGKELPVQWERTELDVADYTSGIRLRVQHPKEVAQVTWHGGGDYFASVMNKGERQAVIIHQLSKRHSQSPFSKSKGWVQCVRFHPVKPILFVAFQRFVRVYDLLQQKLMKKLQANCKWVSSLDIHPGGDNLIIGSYDCRTSWFDLDLRTTPYQTLKYHKRAVRQVVYHRRYPLFASASDDGTVIVCHGQVYNDLLQNAHLQAVKHLRGHTITRLHGVMDCAFHPSQPFLYSAGADGTIRCYHN